MNIKSFKIGDKIQRTKPCDVGAYKDRSYMAPGAIYAGWMNNKIYIQGYCGESKLHDLDLETWQNDWELVPVKKQEPVKIEYVLITKSEYDKLAFRANMADTMKKVIEHQDARLAKVSEALKN